MYNILWYDKRHPDISYNSMEEMFEEKGYSKELSEYFIPDWVKSKVVENVEIH